MKSTWPSKDDKMDQAQIDSIIKAIGSQATAQAPAPAVPAFQLDYAALGRGIASALPAPLTADAIASAVKAGVPSAADIGAAVKSAVPTAKDIAGEFEKILPTAEENAAAVVQAMEAVEKDRKAKEKWYETPVAQIGMICAGTVLLSEVVSYGKARMAS